MVGVAGTPWRIHFCGVAAAAMFAAAAHAQTGQGPVPPLASEQTAAPAQPPQSQSGPSAQPLASEDHPLADPAAARSTTPGTPSHHASAGKPWLTQTLMSLGAVLGLALAAAGLFKFLARHQTGLRASLGAAGRSPAGIMEILGRYPVSRGATLVLLKLDRRILLLSQTAGGRLGAGAGFQTLCEITDAEEIASILVKARDADGDSMSEKFRSILGRFDRAMETPEDDSGRRITATPAGDRAELWDERNPIPVVDLTKQPGPPETAAGSLRRRLASIRPSAEGGQRA